MNRKHLELRMNQLLVLAEASNCPRGKVAAIIVDPTRNRILADGYNGPPRGNDKLCGGNICIRNEQNIASGKEYQIGCHHAEANLIFNAAANGTSTRGAWLLTNVEPCLGCAKAIHHADIAKVITIAKSYAGGREGISYLMKYNVPVHWFEF